VSRNKNEIGDILRIAADHTFGADYLVLSDEDYLTYTGRDPKLISAAVWTFSGVYILHSNYQHSVKKETAIQRSLASQREQSDEDE